MLYPSRKEKNDPKGDSEVTSQSPHPHHNPTIYKWLRTGARLPPPWFWRVRPPFPFQWPRLPLAGAVGVGCCKDLWGQLPRWAQKALSKEDYSQALISNGLCLAKFWTWLETHHPFLLWCLPLGMRMFILCLSIVFWKYITCLISTEEFCLRINCTWFKLFCDLFILCVCVLLHLVIRYFWDFAQFQVLWNGD